MKQKRGDKNKIYSLHEPHIYCMSKGKDHKKYELGTKASVAKTRDSNILIGALAFEENRYDGHTLPEAFAQIERILGHVPKICLGDCGYGCCRIQLQKVDAGSLFLACDYPAVIFLENQPGRSMATQPLNMGFSGSTKYPKLLDADGTVRNRYEVVGLPMSYLIGRDGKISGRVVGVIDWTSRDAIHLIETIL